MISRIAEIKINKRPCVSPLFANARVPAAHCPAIGTGARLRAADKLQRMRATGVAAVLDTAWVMIFVLIGRASHVKGESLAGIASTSWPFLCGLAAGWALSFWWARARPGWVLAVRPAGVVVWLCTVALGMALRVIAGQGTAPAFIVVALVFLGLFLLGWRAAWRLLTAARGGAKAAGRA